MQNMKSEISREDAHRIKMESKKRVRAYQYEKQKYDPVYISANLGVNHPDYGMSMRDHMLEKAKRAESE